MKNTIGYILLTGAATSGLLAVWTPVGSWIQWLITGTILLIAGASILGTTEIPTEHADDGEIHTHKTHGSTPEQIVEDTIKRQNTHQALRGATQDDTEPHNDTGSHPADPETPTGRTRPQYGKPGDDE